MAYRLEWLLAAFVIGCGESENASTATAGSGQGGASAASTSTSSAVGSGGAGGGNACPPGQAELAMELSVVGPAAGAMRPMILAPLVGVPVAATLCSDPFGADTAAAGDEYDGVSGGGTLVFEGPNAGAVPADMAADFATIEGLRFQILEYDSGQALVVLSTNSGEGAGTWGIRLECTAGVTGNVDPNDVQPAAMLCNDGGRVDLVYGQNTEWVVGTATFAYAP